MADSSWKFSIHGLILYSTKLLVHFSPRYVYSTFGTPGFKNVKINTDYFPLNVGDYHLIDFIGKRTIDTIVKIDGIDYYQQVSDNDTIFYRKTSDGKVYQKLRTETEILKFDLNAEVGETWTYKFDDSDVTWDVTLTSKNETIKLDNYTFQNCYGFYFDVAQYADEEHTIWLAPGVGVVEEVWFGGTADRKILKKARINGVEIEF